MRTRATLRALSATAAGALLVALAPMTPTAAAPQSAAGAAKVGGTRPSAVASQDGGCTLSASLDYRAGEFASCLAVGAKLDHVPAVGQTATLTITVKAARSEANTGVTVDLPANLAFADGTATRAATTGSGAVRRATVATASLAKDSTHTYTRRVKAIAAGFGEIAVRASNVIDATRTDGGASSVFVTIGKTAAASRFGHAGSANTAGATVRTTARVTRSLSAPARVIDVPSGPKPSTQVPSGAHAPGTSCATGFWFFVDQNSNTVGAHNVTVQVYRGATLVASGFTGGDGSYTLCWSTGGVAQTVFVHFDESNNVWSLLNSAGTSGYTFNTGNQTIADGATGNFGFLQPADAAVMRGLHAFQEADNEWQWMYQWTPYLGGCWSPLESTCRSMTIHWQSDSTTGTFANANNVWLLAGSPDTLTEPVHEYGHVLMYELYGQSYPATTNCGSHDLFVTSSTTCGFTEGWADWVATSVYNNMVWTYNGGFQRNMDVTWNEGLGYPNGDQVEARIVQGLRSLTDGVKAPFDNDPGEGGGIADNSKFFHTLGVHHPSTLADFWNDRALDGYDVGQTALSALYQGTVDYGFRNPLGDYSPKVIPEAVPDHNYSYDAHSNYWSVVAEKPTAGSDADMSLYSDFNHGSNLANSGYGGNTTDFVAVNSNVRALQTYYPVVRQFAGTGGYTIEVAQGTETLPFGTKVTTFGANELVHVYDSFQTIGVPVTYRAVPDAGVDVQLFVFDSAGSVVARPGASATSAGGGAGIPTSLTYTPTTTGWHGIVLLDNNAAAGNVTVYADSTPPTGSLVLNNSAAKTNKRGISLAITGTDAETGVVDMQVAVDGVPDTEPFVPFSTTAGGQLPVGPDGTKTVVVRLRNNAGMTTDVSDTIVLDTHPNLKESAVSNPPATATRGSAFSVTDTAQNTAQTSTGVATVTGYYLSLDAVKDASDVHFTGTRAVPVLAGGATNAGSTSVAVPATTPAGQYFLLACADDTNAVNPEFNEGDNCKASATKVTIQLPDYVETAVSNPPATTTRGSSFAITDTAKNQGNRGSTFVAPTRYYLSTNTAKDAADLLLTGSRTVPTLLPAGVNSGTATVTVPATAAHGTYFVLACADDTNLIGESNETNNCKASATTVVVQAPDLVVSTVTNPPASVVHGGTISETDTTRNNGNASAAASRTRYFLSVDNVFQTADVSIGGRNVPALAGAATNAAAVTLTVPAATAPGNYFLIVCADGNGAVNEDNETNNCRVAVTKINVT